MLPDDPCEGPDCPETEPLGAAPEGFLRSKTPITPPQRSNMNAPGYEALANALKLAYDQSAYGKGAERHADDRPFHEQPILDIARNGAGYGFLAGQANKKVRELSNMLRRAQLPHDRHEFSVKAMHEAKGAIVYLAALLLYVQECLDNDRQF